MGSIPDAARAGNRPAATLTITRQTLVTPPRRQAVRLLGIAGDGELVRSRWECESRSNGGTAYTVELTHQDCRVIAAQHILEPGTFGPVCTAAIFGRECRHVKAAVLADDLITARSRRASWESRRAVHPDSAAYYDPIIARWEDLEVAAALGLAALGMVFEEAA